MLVGHGLADTPGHLGDVDAVPVHALNPKANYEKLLALAAGSDSGPP